MSSVEKLSEYSSLSVEQLAQECGTEVADVQEWCRNGLINEGDVSLYDFLRFKDDRKIEVDEENSPELTAARKQLEEEDDHIAGKIIGRLEYGRVA